MEKGITKKERDYILFNIRGFFKHYKIEQNINKISIDISNLQKMTNEVNNLINDINEYKEELSSNSKILNDNKENKENKRLLVNRRHKMITKSTDTATKKIVENKQKLKLNDLKYDLNKSNLTLRPKTPDVSKIFNRYKKKKYNTKRNSSNKFYINNNNYNTIGSNSFVQSNNFLSKYNDNSSMNKTNNLINKSNYLYSENNVNDYNNYNRTQYKYKYKKDNSFDNKEKDFHTLNYTMTKFPNEYKNIKNINKLNLNDKLKKKDLSPNKITSKKDNKNKNIKINNNTNKNNLNNIKKFDNNNINNKAFKTKKFNKKSITNKYLNERFHSFDIIKPKTNKNLNINQNNKNNINNINKKINKKVFNFRNRNNVKTPSPLYYRQTSPLLIDHDTIIRNKNKKINYNGNYYNEKINQKKISNSNINKKKKNNYYFKKKSDDKINQNQKDITKEEEKKLDEQIINTTINNATTDIIQMQNDTQINNTKNIMDLSQNILQNLEYMNNMEINKSGNNSNIMNLSDINNKNNSSNKNLDFELLKKNSDNLFKSNYIESLYLSIKLGFFTPWEKLKLLLISKELNFKFNIKDIIIDYINYYEKQILLINNEIKKYDINRINKPFTPRKTGLNSLNFITKNEEQRLISEQQHEYVIKIFKIILILLDEYNNYINSLNENENGNSNENGNNSKIFEYLFNEVYKKNNVNNIKDLFINNFVDKIPLISDTQFNMINDIIKEVPELLSPSTLLAYNRNVSYLTFFLSELYNYFATKTNDDDIYYLFI